MGLNTSHGCWDGPYSSFNSWRKDVCAAANLGDLDSYKGHGGVRDFPTHPLTPLLDHSDCDGEIKWKDCDGIAKALKEVLPKFKKDAYNHDKTTRFIEGCTKAFKAKQNVVFQ